ncbi:unnamed protein product [Adineta steineri]|uniref:RING-type domain-containing protein n=1 Tax=Adineta steineri TaxID=433720 RepID=A0A813XHD7_9BILA|nr:unnamed protein product [Adineta steineri]CAF0807072.1 unnamed protein product [Adineta steineri]CAF0837277.1 unnamed protein product [Adineta steineri]CAF0865280.1 unnamed protein product [Adineta steineri]CAF0931055.1 unnamed protein product [Adineta steineri]
MGSNLTAIPSSVSLPIFGVGLTTLCLSLCFCCYLWRLRRDTLREKGYRKDQYMRCKVKNSNCVICLDDFYEDEEIAVCPCEHAFHKRCLSPWLQHNCTCPMCNMCIKPETSGSCQLPDIL